MKILLDENLDARLIQHLTSFEVSSVAEQGWSGLKNGILLQKMRENNFTHLITGDKTLGINKVKCLLLQRESALSFLTAIPINLPIT